MVSACKEGRQLVSYSCPHQAPPSPPSSPALVLRRNIKSTTFQYALASPCLACVALDTSSHPAFLSPCQPLALRPLLLPCHTHPPRSLLVAALQLVLLSSPQHPVCLSPLSQTSPRPGTSLQESWLFCRASVLLEHDMMQVIIWALGASETGSECSALPRQPVHAALIKGR